MFQQAYMLVNAFVVGRFAGDSAMGAIQSATCISSLATCFGMGSSAGCAVVVGQYFGAYDDEGVSRSAATTIGLAIVVGLVMSGFGLLLSEPILRMLNTPPDIFNDANTVAHWMFGGMTFYLIFVTGGDLLRAVGDSKTPSLILIVTCLFNIALDIVIVGYLKMGIRGSSISLATSWLFGALYTLVVLHRARGSWCVRFGKYAIDKSIALSMLRCGVPLGIQNSVYSVTNIIAQGAINSFGTAACSGWGLSGRIHSIVCYLGTALNIAITTFSAQNYGARKIHRVKELLRVSVEVSVLMVGVIAFIIYIFSDTFSAFFVSDPDTIKYSIISLHYLEPLVIVFMIGNAMGAIMRGCGQSFVPMVLTLIGTCVLRVIWYLVVVPKYHTYEVVMASFPVTWCVTTILLAIYYFKGGWLQENTDR